MANASDEKAVITEKLRDTGLDESSVTKCLQMIEEKQFAALERYLKTYRQTLLDSVHTYNERIDCLDFLTYTIRKKRRYLK